jgi:maleate cis-trans isomerase
MTAAALRTGLLVPINNTTMEPELLQWLPAGSTCHRLGIPRGKGMLTPADLPAYLAHTVELARTFATAGTDLIAYGCTAAGFMAGPQRDAEVAAEISGLTRKPVVTTASAMTAALRELGARRVTVVTPYLDAVNERLTAFIEASGTAVENLVSFRAETVDALAAITPGEIVDLARAAMSPRSDAMFIACSQLPTRAIIGGLERDFGRPVWSSIRATAWAAGIVTAVIRDK